MISIATVVQLSKAAMEGTSVFIEHDNALGWTDFVYGCIASANLIGDVLSLLFAENSVRITGSDAIAQEGRSAAAAGSGGHDLAT